MRIYNATRFVFPRSYALRIFSICFASVHFPLIGFGILEAVRGDWKWDVFFALLAATLAGTLAAILGLRGMLRPFEIATTHLRLIQDGKLVENVPTGGPDLAGRLLESVARAAHSTSARMDVLRGVAGTDPLTGLRNRRGFQETVLPLLSAGHAGAIAMLDGDQFKLINDRLGHAEGDRQLLAIVRRIGENVRVGDIAARWGGDEFVIFLPGLDENGARHVVERIYDALMRRPEAVIDGKPIAFSYGIADIRSAGRQGLDEALQRADRSLYAGKESRRAA